MTNLIIFILCSAGLTQILCYAKILENVRPKKGFFGELFSCSMCVGFHVGYVMFLLFWHHGVTLFPHMLVGSLVFSLVSSFTSYILDKLVSDEGLNVKSAKLGNNSDYPHDKWI